MDHDVGRGQFARVVEEDAIFKHIPRSGTVADAFGRALGHIADRFAQFQHPFGGFYPHQIGVSVLLGRAGRAIGRVGDHIKDDG